MYSIYIFTSMVTSFLIYIYTSTTFVSGSYRKWFKKRSNLVPYFKLFHNHLFNHSIIIVQFTQQFTVQTVPSITTLDHKSQHVYAMYFIPKYFNPYKNFLTSNVLHPLIFYYLTLYSLLVMWCTNRFNIQEFYVLPHCFYVFCFYLRTNSYLCHLHHKLISFIT
jgi:hypothetical protein